MKSYFRTLSTVIVCLSCTLLCAAPVSQSAALQQAQSFLAQRGRLCTLQSCETGRANKPNKVNQASSAPYHIFNVAGNGGFVIVSGDDNAMPILGYADQGYIDPDNMPNALRELLDGYADEMAYLTSHNLSAPAQAPSRKIQLIRRPIAPLIQTRWNQNGGYNHFTPTDQTPNGMKHSYTGCIATSMAQLMYYHRWPNATTQTIPGYLAPSLNRQLDSLPVTAFDYDAMALVYNNNTDSSAIIAVSKLMQYCGWAMELDYTTAGTSGFSEFIPNALIDYFDYDSSATYVQRLNYSYEGWMDLLYNELANGRPLANSL